MKKFIFWIFFLVLLLGAGFMYVVNNPSLPLSKPSENVIKTSIEEKGNTMCTMEYAPVCALVAIPCINAPCNPIEQTFGNTCQMNANSLAVFLHDGECIAK